MARPLFRRGSQAGSVYMDCEEAFKLIDKNGDGVLSRIEVIQACRTDARVAKLLRLPQRIHQEDGSRDRFEEIFQMMDEDDSKEVDLQEFQKFWVTHVLRAPAPPHERQCGRGVGGGGVAPAPLRVHGGHGRAGWASVQCACADRRRPRWMPVLLNGGSKSCARA